MKVSSRRLFTIGLVALMAVPVAGLEAIVSAPAAGAAVTAYGAPSIVQPYGITTGSDGALWFTNFGSNSIGRTTSTGSVTNYTDPGINQPYGITAGPDGNLWFTSNGSSSIGRITTAGVITLFTDPTISQPFGITAGPDGALWFTNGGSDGSIGRISVTGTVTNFTGPTLTFLTGITAGPDGALWFTSDGTNSIGRITTTGTVSNYTDPGVLSPENITTGPDGALWFADYGSDSIGRITTAGVITNFFDSLAIDAPYAIASGSDGALWFTNLNGSSIGRISTAGVVTKYTDPGIVNPQTITAGPGGALWFTNYTGDTIGRITTDSTGSCGTDCVTVFAKPGVPSSSRSGPPTPAHPTKQIVTLPLHTGAHLLPRTGAPGVRITLQSINPGPNTSAADRQLCPTSGTRCSGQISVFAGNFKPYVSRSHPIKIQIIAKWQTKVPPGRMLMTKDTGGPPIQLAGCVIKGGQYNTPCVQPEVVSGSAAQHNLITTDTILFIGNDPHVGRRVSNTPDAPTAVKATAGKKQAVVQWKVPVVTNGRLTGYLVTPHLGHTALRPVSVGATATKATIKNLKTGSSYTFTVAAKNAHGLSYQSIASRPVKPK